MVLTLVISQPKPISIDLNYQYFPLNTPIDQKTALRLGLPCSLNCIPG
jgi:hypothetical protein